jgi:hypothetical protein
VTGTDAIRFSALFHFTLAFENHKLPAQKVHQERGENEGEL